MVAAPIGMPGWPEFACCTASIDSMRIVLMQSWSRSSVEAGVSTSGSVAGRWFMIGTLKSVVTSRSSAPVRRSAQYFLIRWLTARLAAGGHLVSVGVTSLFVRARRASLLMMNDTCTSSASNASRRWGNALSRMSSSFASSRRVRRRAAFRELEDMRRVFRHMGKT